MSASLPAAALIALLADPGSYRSWDEAPDHGPVDDGYAAALARARARTGTDEAVLTGEATVHGHRVALIVSEFGFLGGSIGVATAARIARAFRRAAAGSLPVVASTASGGTRMQEGAPAFAAMAGITAAIAEHRRAKLPYLVYLRHPTTGGVLASWGSLGQITIGQPQALVGFLGPAVYRSLSGEQFPAGVQTAENLHRHGLLDAVLAPEELAGFVGRALNLLRGTTALPASAATAGGPDPGAAAPDVDAAAPDVGESIRRTRRPSRPGLDELLDAEEFEVLALHGTAEGESDPALLLALARIRGSACVLVGQHRRLGGNDTAPGPAALRQARRGMALAAALGLPLVTVIDTAGAELSAAAEEGGLAGAIARCLLELVELEVPVLSILLGAGCGGAALALLPADLTVAAEHAWLAPLAPEGASTILHGHPGCSWQVAAAQRIDARSLQGAGVVDVIVPEGPDTAAGRLRFRQQMAGTIAAELAALAAECPAERQQRRRDKYARLAAVPQPAA